MGSRVELFEQIRRGSRVDGLSVRALAKRHRVHRRTIRQALISAQPPRPAPRRWRARKIAPFVGAIDDMLRTDRDAPRKQRHTARRILARLIDEHDAADLVSYSTLRDYVAKRRPEIAAETGDQLIEAFVPQTHEPGREAEVDFAELYVDLPEGRTKCFLFTMRLSMSGKAVHRVYATQSQEAFLEGHLAAFDEFAGIPTGHIRYDNLKSAVSRVLFGDRDRIENQRWVLFRSHQGFEAFYCIPGLAGAHEKGGVEGEGGRFRRNHLVPVPKVASLAQLNERLAQADRDDDDRRIGHRIRTVGEDFATEQPLLRALPAERFEPGLTLAPRVDRHGRIMVRSSQYSVPARFIGRRVRVRLRSNELFVSDGSTPIAHHERSIRKGAQVLDLDHYLEVLKIKPGALPGATALVQARAAGTFTSAHEAFWAAARKAHGDAAGTRALIDVLLLHRHMRHADVTAGLSAALNVGSTNADVVAVEARLAAHHHGGGAAVGAALADTSPVEQQRRVISLTERRLTDPAAVIAGLPPDTRAVPSLAGYDDLLTRRAARTAQFPLPVTGGVG